MPRPSCAAAFVDKPETVATAIRIGHPQSWDQAWRCKPGIRRLVRRMQRCRHPRHAEAAVREGRHLLRTRLRHLLAGALRDLKAGKIPEGSTIVCTLTGNGLKDPDTAIGQCDIQPSKVAATLDAVKGAILRAM